jgi:dethiobiotin synthetase
MVFVVTGTGTGIGKTHFSEALLLSAGHAGLRAAGVKPIESGVSPCTLSDAERLRAASTFHVKPFGYALPDPVSPHLAARIDGRTLRIDPIVAAIHDVQAELDLLLVELPGGLFTPLTPSALNVDLAAALRPDRLLLVAPDRLGVLHDVIAAARAARAHPLRIDGIVLVTPESPDSATGHNAADIPSLTDGLPVVATIPRASATCIAAAGALRPCLPRCAHSLDRP